MFQQRTREKKIFLSHCNFDLHWVDSTLEIEVNRTLTAYRNYLLNLKGIEPTHPFGQASLWYKLAGKMVSLTMLEAFTFQGQSAPTFHFINLKCDPDRAEELRASNP